MCIKVVSNKIFTGSKVDSLPVIKQKDEQIFSNFSVETRTIIGSCLEAIQCIEDDKNSQCLELSDICHSKGPQPTNVGPPLTRQKLECRIENILCHIDKTLSSEKCLEKYEKCNESTGVPQSRENLLSNETHGKIFAH